MDFQPTAVFLRSIAVLDMNENSYNTIFCEVETLDVPTFCTSPSIYGFFKAKF